MASLRAIKLYSQFIGSNRYTTSYYRTHLKYNNYNFIINNLARSSIVTSSTVYCPVGDFKASEVLARERYELRSGEDTETKRSRLLYQSRKRGMLENGLILASFADKYLKQLDNELLDQYDRLINLPTNDWDIYYWATRTKPTPHEFENTIMQKLRDHLKQKVSESPELFPSYDQSSSKNDHSEIMTTQFPSDSFNTKLRDNEEDGDKLAYVEKEDHVNLDIDPRTIDISRPETVFSDGKINLSRTQTMVKMTQWRKDFFLKRMRRTMPAPVSLTGLGDGSDPRFWTQRIPELVAKIGAQNKLKHTSLESSLEFSSSLVWMIENEKEIIMRDYPEVYDLYQKKIELEKLKKTIDAEQNDEIFNEIVRFPYILSASIVEEKNKRIEDKSKKAKYMIMSDDDNSACPSGQFLVEGQTPRFAISGEIDEDFDKYLKHHNLLQKLSSKRFATEPEEYDEEMKAWTDSIWHRSYGSSDLYIPPSKVPCGGCGAILHCSDPGLPGFVPKEVYSDYLAKDQNEKGLHGKKCQRCKFIDTYNVALDVNVSRFDYANLMSHLKKDPQAVVVLMIDVLDFPCSVWPGILDVIGPNRKVYVVGNKVDLLPKDSDDYLSRIQEALEANLRNRLRWDDRNLHLADVCLISAKTGFGIEHLITKLINAHDVQRNIYMVGCTNVGKSTLFNTLLQSDLCGVRENDIITRASTSIWPGTTLNILKFPIAKFQGWQMELRKARLIRQQRKRKAEIARMVSLNRRQQTTPHMSMLIERVEPSFKSKVPVKIETDHPMSDKILELSNLKPFDATTSRFSNHSFFHDTPGTCHSDQILDLLTSEELLRAMPRETIIPRTFAIRPSHSLFISGLARVDLLTATSSIWLTVFASNYLPVHIVETAEAERFYYTYLGTSYLGVPLGNKKRFESWPELHSVPHEHTFDVRGTEQGWKKGLCDIVLSNAGWTLVTTGPDQDCILKAYTPEGRGIYLRDPPLLPAACHLKGRRIKDTPCYKYSRYSVDQIRMPR